MICRLHCYVVLPLLIGCGCCATPQVLGPIPESMASRSDKHTAKYFTAGPQYKLSWPEGATSRKSLRAVRRLTDLRELLSNRADQSVAGSAEAVEALASLIEGLLR